MSVFYFDSEENECFCATCAHNHPCFQDFEAIGESDIGYLQQSVDDDKDIVCARCDRVLIELD
jgi:hypothetical protein